MLRKASPRLLKSTLSCLNRRNLGRIGRFCTKPALWAETLNQVLRGKDSSQPAERDYQIPRQRNPRTFSLSPVKENALWSLSGLRVCKIARKIKQSSISSLKWLILWTIWRRERDSNPRYPFRHNGFQDRRYQPLTHPSAERMRSVSTSLPHLLLSHGRVECASCKARVSQSAVLVRGFQ